MNSDPVTFSGPDGPLISVLTTGGTIASRSGQAGAVPELSGHQLVGGIIADTVGATVRVRDILSKDSAALTPSDQDVIRRAVADDLADPAVSGIVVLHGTDTLEETSMLVDLDHDDRRPVVFTGAQFADDHPDSDGPANIGSAIAVAADPAAQGRGTLLAFSGAVVPVRGIIKADTIARSGFVAPPATLARPMVPSHDIAGVRVDIVALYPGVDPAVLAWSAAAGAHGIVLQANGSGNTHPDVVTAVTELVRDGVVVVVSTRVPFGPVIPTYGGGGGAVDLVTAGAVVSPWLRPPQARMALMAALAAGWDASAIADFFSRSVPTED